MRPCVLPLLFALLLIAGPAAAQAPSMPGGSRGALLYNNHCVECHNTQMHWRSQRLAHDWESLRAQVRRWQGDARLRWNEDDIDAVARYLNETIYRFPERQARQ